MHDYLEVMTVLLQGSLKTIPVIGRETLKIPVYFSKAFANT
jgi:hypothetical protein